MLTVLSGTSDLRDSNAPGLYGSVEGMWSVQQSAGVFDAPYYGYAINYDMPRINALLSSNQTWTQGSMILDTGCDSTLMSTIYEPFLNDVLRSESSICGFDGSTVKGGLQGYSHMFFLQQGKPPDPCSTSTGQGVEQIYYDTVDGLRENLLSVAKFYEDGAQIRLHRSTWSGVRGVRCQSSCMPQIHCTLGHSRYTVSCHVATA